MKKTIALLLSALVLLGLVGCTAASKAPEAPVSNSVPASPVSAPADATTPASPPVSSPSPSATPSSPSPIPEGCDLTVNIDGFTVTPEAANNTVDGGESAGAYFISVYPNAASQCGSSRLIVVGTVENVRYTDTDGIALTYYDLRLEEVWEGALSAGDLITVEKAGGYVRGDVFAERHNKPGLEALTAEDLIRESNFGLPFPKPGDRYALFLTTGRGGVYNTLGDFMSVYFIDGESVSRYLPKSEAGLYDGMDYTPDPDTLPGLRDTVLKALDGLETPPAPTFEEVGKNYQAMIDYYAEMYKDIELYDNTVKRVNQLDAFYKLTDFIKTVSSAQDKHPTAIVLSDKYQYLVAGGDTFASRVIELAGGVNAASDLSAKGDFADVSIADILEMDPDYIFIAGVEAGYTLEDIINDPEWQSLSAVINGNVIAFPNYRHQWMIQFPDAGSHNIHSCLAAAFMLSKFYPEVYSWDKFKTDAVVFYNLNDGEDHVYTAESLGFD